MGEEDCQMNDSEGDGRLTIQEATQAEVEEAIAEIEESDQIVVGS
ncbi:hypothetical protein OB955_19785 [Halobacteria archaeon AArc-m2/3/4]|uniref:Uncharacterized protein n=1 Tax=Natronoglomus mannanivorans TaxID=2979990 RepID=A0ABT2QJ60_9EURY|nr:hypothetical protein [Halobacteria archaeon AArc-m2/3/4]